MQLSSKKPAPTTVPGLGQDDIRDLCQEGIASCRQGRWEEGVRVLYAVVGTHPQANEIPSLAYSYLGYGLASLKAKYRDGMLLCRLGIRKDPAEAENYFNLARTCFLRGRRRMAVSALNRGLRLSPRNPELLKLRDVLGRRQPPVVPFLHRGHTINCFLGKLRSRKVINLRDGNG